MNHLKKVSHLLLVALAIFISSSYAFSLGRESVKQEGVLLAPINTHHALQQETMREAGSGDSEGSIIEPQLPVSYANEDDVIATTGIVSTDAAHRPVEAAADGSDAQENAHGNASALRAPRSASECADPSEEQLRSQLAAQAGVSNQAVGAPIQQSTFGGCPADFLSTTLTSFEDRALCPWTNVAHHDTTRYPRDILYAQCACPKCIVPGPVSSVYMTTTLQAGCKPVLGSRPVLRRGECVDGIYQYDIETLPLPIACICARSVIH